MQIGIYRRYSIIVESGYSEGDLCLDRLSLNQPPQQLPGLPQLLGLPQQLPGMFPIKSLLEEAVLWADISFARFLLLHDLQSSSSLFPKTKNSFISPQFPHLYS
jgi:hypothetical protein